MKKNEEYYRWFIGVMITLMVAILSGMATLQFKSANRFETFFINNNEEHSSMSKKIDKEISYTHSIYKYEINPNTLHYKSLQTKLDKLKVDVKKNFVKIKEIERKIK